MLLRRITLLLLTFSAGLSVSACQVELNTEIDYSCTSDDQCIESFLCLNNICVDKTSQAADASGTIDAETAGIADSERQKTALIADDAAASRADVTASDEEVTEPEPDVSDLVADATQGGEDTAGPEACNAVLPDGAVCNPYCEVGAQGCEAPLVCALNSAQELACLTGGELMLGDVCDPTANACGPGLACITLTPYEWEAHCHAFCQGDAA